MKAKYTVPAAAFSLAALGLGDIYKYVFSREPGPLLHALERKNHQAGFYIRKNEAAAAMAALPRRRYTMVSGRGDELVGYCYPCGDKPSKKIAFIAHGHRSDHLDTGGIYLPGYHARGFDVFGCDHAAHGESGGKHIGFGAFEPEDCLQWLELLLAEYGRDVEIVLHGFSMGGATVLRMSDRIPENVRFIIEDSGFSSAKEMLEGKLGLLYQPVRLLQRLFTGYDMDRVEPRLSVQNSRCPILFVHGSSDVTVPFEMATELYELCGAEKDSLLLPGVPHIEAMHTHSGEYWAKIDGFIEKYMK